MENFTIDTTLYPIADNPSILLSESYPTFAPMNEMQSLDFWGHPTKSVAEPNQNTNDI